MSVVVRSQLMECCCSPSSVEGRGSDILCGLIETGCERLDAPDTDQ